MIKKYDIFNLDLESSKKAIIDELEQKGRKDIQILSCEPIGLGLDKGYTIEVSFETKTLDIEDIINIKRLLFSKSLKLEELNRKRKIIQDEIEEISGTCKHEIVVEMSENREMDGTCWQEARCLICGRQFLCTEYFSLDMNKFKNIIYFNNTDFSNKEKMNIVFKQFCDEKTANPNLSDREIVEIINEKINEKAKQKMLP